MIYLKTILVKNAMIYNDITICIIYNNSWIYNILIYCLGFEQGGIDFVYEIYAEAETYFVAELNYRKYLIYF